MPGKFASLSATDRKKLKQYGVVAVAVFMAVGTIYYSFLTVSNLRTRAEQSSVQLSGGVSVEGNSGSGVKVNWTTNEPFAGVIEYGTSPDQLTSQAVSPGTSTDNSVLLQGLEPDKKYYFRLKINDKVYDNGGQPYEIPAGSASSTNETETKPDTGTDTSEATPSASPSEDNPETTPETSVTPDTSIIPTPTVSPDEPIDPGTISSIPTPTSAISCGGNNCSTIWNNRNSGCTLVDYLKCVAANPASTISNIVSSVTSTTAPTSTPTSGPTATTGPTAIPVVAGCDLSYLQADSCTTWRWEDMKNKLKACSDSYTKYFIQCKSSSFTSSDSATWYCNTTGTTNSKTLPCDTGGPTPAPGQSVFCRVRGETATGGDNNATSWIYGNTACSQVNNTNAACNISYVQSNNCRSFIWDLINEKDPSCSPGFDHYFLQCKSSSFAVSETAGTWYCNKTSDVHYLDLPCYNAPTPADGASIYCRVRAEDAYSTTSHATDWASTNDICPTSTPTPTPTPTDTPTPTPTP